MDRQPNFEFLCRVCAANTKGKNSVAECVYILKTPSLKDKIEKYLYLSISEHDALPKVLCKTCFRQVEATASLSKIAKHTQKVFRDFLFSTKPPSQNANINYDNEEVNATAEFTPIVLNTLADGGDEASKSRQNSTESSTAATAVVTAAAVPATGTFSSSSSSASSRKDEVVVNVSVSDPLTRETQQKMISASQKRQNSLDARFTPKSIAQRAFSTSTPKQQTESSGSSTASTAAAAAAAVAGKKPSPPGVINFFHGRPQQVTTFTSGGYIIGRVATSVPDATATPGTESAATKVASSIETAPGASAAGQILQQKRKNLKMALNSIKANTGQVSLLKASQKPLPQPQPSPPPPAEASPRSLSKSSSSLTPPNDDDDDVLAEELPEKMIIAAAKHRKQKKEQQQQQKQQQKQKQQQQKQQQEQERKEQERKEQEQLNKQQEELQLQLYQLQQEQKRLQQQQKLQQEQQQQQQQHQQQQLQKRKSTPKAIITEPESEPPTTAEDLTKQPKSGLPDDILLGKVIKDIDLLKLILTALKWPVTKQTMDAQMSRLRNSRFATIMSDPNLLQDTDLTQILGPYLAPVLMAAHALQQQQLVVAMAAAAAATATPARPTTAAGITSAIPYKLPAETSVQLVPASPPTEPQQQQQPEPLQENNATTKSSSSTHTSVKRRDARSTSASSSQDKHNMPPPRKIRKAAQKARDSIVISDEEGNDDDEDYQVEGEASTITNDTSSMRRSSKSTPNFHVNIDPSTLFAQFGIFAAAASSATGSLSSSNDALAALLQRQRAALTRTQRSSQRRKRSNSIITVPASGAFDLSFDDDIVLMEQQLPHQNSPLDSAPATTAAASATPVSTSSSSSLSNVSVGNFLMPQPVDSIPLITRPIIKRRKTVIQASPARTNLNINKITISTTAASANTNTTTAMTNSTTKALSSVAVSVPVQMPIPMPLPLPPQKKHSQRSTNAIAAAARNIAATQYSATTVAASIATQVPSQTREIIDKSRGANANATTSTVGTSTLALVSHNNAATATTAAGGAVGPSETLPPVKTYSKKLHTSKSALGKQLLEAIGLQEITSNTKVDGTKSQQEPAASTRESVQQIRSALKKSLQKAQEQQQQRKQEEPIKQDADSTTKSIVKEVKSINLDDDDDELDVESQIDKITLMKPNKTQSEPEFVSETVPAVVPEAATTPGSASENKEINVEEKAKEIRDKDRKNKLVSRIPSMRRGKTAAANRSLKSAQAAEDKQLEKAELEDTKEKDSQKSSSNKKELELAGNATTTIGATLQKAESIISLASSKPSTPRKRGRKAKAQKKFEVDYDDIDDDDSDENDYDDENDDDDVEFKIRETTSKRRAGILRKGAADRDYCEKDSDTASLKNDPGDAAANAASPTRRPTRVSKTLSKYYKGPEETTSTSRRSVPMRSTRNRT